MQKLDSGSISCTTACYLHWIEYPLSPIILCPGCTTYIGSDGLTHRSINTFELPEEDAE